MAPDQKFERFKFLVRSDLVGSSRFYKDQMSLSVQCLRHWDPYLYPHENIYPHQKRTTFTYKVRTVTGKIGSLKNNLSIYWPSYCKKRNVAFSFCLEAVIFKSLIPLVLSLRYSQSLYRCLLYICQYLLIELFLYGHRPLKYYPSDSLRCAVGVFILGDS